MPRISAEAMELRRGQILDAAERCFARDGFHQATIQAVIAESGLSAGGIYGHFRSKDDIVAAIAERRHAHDAELLSSLETTDDPIEALRRVARAFLQDLETEAGVRRRQVALQLWAEALRSPTIRREVVAGVRGPAAIVRGLLERAVEAGAIGRDAELDGAARAMVALFQGLVLQRLWGEPVSEDQAMAAFEALLRGFSVAGAPQSART
jgi:AcrR family transcriptional regulator